MTDAERIARDAVVRAALRIAAREFAGPHADSDADAEYQDDQLCQAAARLTELARPRSERAPGWTADPRYDDFRQALGYARSHFSQAAAAHSRLTSEEAYWVWHTVDQGMKRKARNAAEGQVGE